MIASLPEPVAIISTADKGRLQALARSLAAEYDPMASMITRKLARSEIRGLDNIPDGRLMLDSFVTFEFAASEERERRRLILPKDRMWPPSELSVASPLGLALVGLAAGERSLVRGSGTEGPRWVEVLSVGPAGTNLPPRCTLRQRGTGPSLADQR